MVLHWNRTAFWLWTFVSICLCHVPGIWVCLNILGTQQNPVDMFIILPVEQCWTSIIRDDPPFVAQSHFHHCFNPCFLCLSWTLPPNPPLFYPDDPDDPGLVSRWRDMGYLSVEQLLPLVELLDAPAKPSSSQSQSQGEMQDMVGWCGMRWASPSVSESIWTNNMNQWN